MSSSLFKLCASLACLLLMYLFAIGLDTANGNTLPILVYCVTGTCLIHALIGLPSIYYATEKYYDITGSIGVWSMIIIAIHYSATPSLRACLLCVFACLWTTRLGLFLWTRIQQQREDRRFHTLKKDPAAFTLAWTLSAAWTFISLLNLLTAISSHHQAPLGFIDALWSIGWLIAFSIEAIADWQKRQFKRKQQTTPFIQTGLWRYCRHPNYFGEICLWICVAGISAPNLQATASLSLLSPVFTYWLLTRVSGINLLEAQSDAHYGDLPAYQHYKATTPKLIPKLKRGPHH